MEKYFIFLFKFSDIRLNYFELFVGRLVVAIAVQASRSSSVELCIQYARVFSSACSLHAIVKMIQKLHKDLWHHRDRRMEQMPSSIPFKNETVRKWFAEHIPVFRSVWAQNAKIIYLVIVMFGNSRGMK